MTNARRCVIYVRISRDRYDKRYGVEDQEARCRALAASRGWIIVEVYEDNDESATKEKHPPRYRDMIAALEAGLADVILVDVVDRFGSGRLMWKFAEFMRWREKRGIRLVSCEGDDTDTADGRMILSFKVAMAEREWHKMKERLAKNQRKRATNGQFNGGHRPYYIDHPEAVLWVQQAVTDILGGRSLHAIAKDWQKAGRTTASGGVWSPRTMRRMLLSPSIVGKQEVDGQFYAVPWPGIIDEEVWSAVTAILTDPARRTTEVNQRKYMLSGLLKCGVCESNLISRGSHGAFECPTNKNGCGKVYISTEHLDLFITEAVFFALDSDDFRRAVAASKGSHKEEIAELHAQEAKDNAALTALADEKDDGLVDDAEYRRRRARITARLDDTLTKLTTLRQTERRVSLPATDELRKAWGGYDALKRREIVSAVIDRIDVMPHPRGTMAAPLRRAGEPLEDWHDRFTRHRMATIDDRTTIRWIA